MRLSVPYDITFTITVRLKAHWKLCDYLRVFQFCTTISFDNLSMLCSVQCFSMVHLKLLVVRPREQIGHAWTACWCLIINDSFPFSFNFSNYLINMSICYKVDC